MPAAVQPSGVAQPFDAKPQDSSPPDLTKSAIGAAIGASIGAAVWVIARFLTGYEIGLLAALTGILAGLGAISLNGGKKDIQVGMIAAVIALVGIGVGSYVGFRLEIHALIAQERTYGDEADPYFEQQLRDLPWSSDLNAISGLFAVIGLTWGFRIGSGIRMRRLPRFPSSTGS